MPRLSFVIPTLNYAAFLPRCLEACLAQQVEDAEILVVDGGSTDGTQALLAGYGDRIRWISEKDRGQSDAINKGVRLARGEIVAWINADDYYSSPDVLRSVLARFDADPDLDIVYGDGLLVDAAHQPVRSLPAQRDLTPRRILLFAGMVVSQPALFFRRSLFLEIGGVDEKLHLAMDYDLWIRLFERARHVTYLPRVLATTTSHHDAKTIRYMLRQVHEVLRIKRAHAPRFGLSPLEQARLYGGVASMYVYWLAVRLGLKRAA
jgi:glycosyltransferase involved in cell wall biosynthesis